MDGFANIDLSPQTRDSAHSANSAHDEWEPPAPLRDTKPPPQFPLETTFPSALSHVRDFIAAVAESHQVPIDLPAMMLLPIAGTCIAQKFVVETAPKHTEQPALWTCTLLKSGNRKSSTLKVMTAPLVAWERDQAQRLGPEIARQNEQRKLNDARLQKLRQEASKAKDTKSRAEIEAEAAALAVQMADESNLTTPQLITTEPTTEAVGRLLNNNDERLLIASAEADSVDVMLGRYSRGVPNFSVYLSGHSGDAFRSDRIGRESVHLNHPVLNVALSVQPESVEDLFSNRQAVGRGLLARFHFAEPDSLLGRRKIEPTPIPDQLAAAYEETLRKLLDTPISEAPLTVRLSSDAAALFREFRQWLEPELGVNGALCDKTAWAGKLAGSIARIALALNGMNWATTGKRIAEIDAAVMRAALAWAPYLIEHENRMTISADADPDVINAERVLKWIQKNEFDQFTARDAFSACRNNQLKNMLCFAPVLDLLEDLGYIRRLEYQKHGDRGRGPSPLYAVNPLWSKDK